MCIRDNIDVGFRLKAVAEDFQFGGILRELLHEIVNSAVRGALADDVAEAQDDGAQSERGAERGDERFRRDLASAIQTHGQARAEIFMCHGRADVAIDRAGAGRDDLRNGIAPHGLEDVVGCLLYTSRCV